MNRKHVLILGAIALLYGLILFFPAASFYRWTAAKNDASGIEYYGLQGTLSEGGVAAVNVRGRTVLNNLRWTFKPLWLLLGQRVFVISGGGEQAVVEGRLRIAPTDALTIGNLHVSLHLKDLLSASGQTYLPLDGQVELNLDNLKLKNNQLRRAEGVTQLRGLAWTLAKEPLLLGDFEAKTTTKDDTIQIALQSLSGPIDLNGEIKLAGDQTYQVNLQYRAKPQADPVLRNLISSAGQIDAQGWSHYRAQGRLAQ